METKAFNIIGPSHAEAESITSPSQISRWSLSSTSSFLVFHSLLFLYFVPPWVSAGLTQSTINPLLVKLPQSRITAHLHSFPHCARSFLDQSESLTMYKGFICNLIAYCSPLCAGTPASHIGFLDAVERKVFKIIWISHNEAECLSLLLSHCRQVGGLSVLYHFLLVLHPLPSLCLVLLIGQR